MNVQIKMVDQKTSDMTYEPYHGQYKKLEDRAISKDVCTTGEDIVGTTYIYTGVIQRNNQRTF